MERIKFYRLLMRSFFCVEMGICIYALLWRWEFQTPVFSLSNLVASDYWSSAEFRQNMNGVYGIRSFVHSTNSCIQHGSGD